MDKLKLARIIGLLFSDGSLYMNEKYRYHEISFSLGDMRDVEELQRDLQNFYVKMHIRKEQNLVNIAGRNFTIRVFKVKIASKRIFEIFKALGVPVGKKTDIEYHIPDWISKGTLNIQRQFLAGFLGGDGPKATIYVQSRKNKKPFNSIKINDLEFYKRTDLIDNGFSYAQQIATLLENSGIKVKKVFSKGRFQRKNGSYSTSIHLRLSASLESILAYCDVGFAYCIQKKEATKPVKLFLTEIQKLRFAWKQKHAIAINLYNNGASIDNIAKRLNISYDTVFGWTKYNKKPTVNYHHLKFDKWGERNAIIEL